MKWLWGEVRTLCAVFIVLCAVHYSYVETTPFGNNCIPSKFFDTYRLYDFINRTEPLHFPISKRAKDIVSTLTLPQKIGQMTQLDISMFMNPGTFTLNEASLAYAIQTYGVGSFLNSPFAGGPIQGVSGYNVTGWINLITQIQNIALNPSNSNTSIPIIYGLDSVHGANYILGAVMFPHNLGVGATFNINFAHEIGKIAGRDTRAAGIPWVFAPVADLGAQPLWPRLYETFGEDPYLAAQLAGQVVRGIQDYPNTNLSQSAAACLKHFLGYSDPKSGKDRSPAWIGDRQMRRYFLPGYEAAINAGVRSVMINSGSVNLIPLHSDQQFLTEWLRNEMNFTGVAVTDYQDIEKLNFFHHIAKNYTIATGVSIEAGVDMSMVPLDYSFPQELLNLVKYGYITEDRINLSAERIVQLKIDLGLFENAYPSLNDPNVALVGSEDDRAFAVEVARESITLLRNQNSILPLNPSSLTKILVTGPAANNQSILHGGWSIHWQGAADNEFVYGQTIYQGIVDVLQYPAMSPNDVSVEYVLGTSLAGPVNASEVITAAQNADVVVLCFGEKPEAEWEGDINNLQTDHYQLELYRLLRNSTTTPIILVLISARPRIIMEAAEADAIMWGYLPAGGGGLAIAEIIFGVTNPSGALPITYPQFVNDVGVPYYKTYTDVTTPLYSFGHGLSYTEFTYSNLVISTNSQGQIYMFDNFTVSVTIKNSGSVAGKVPVLLYISDIYASVMPEVTMLKRFEKIELQVGESQTLSWVLTMEDLSYIDRCNEIVIEPGSFNVTVGNLYQTFELVPSPDGLYRPYHHQQPKVNPAIVQEGKEKEGESSFFF